MSPTGTKPDRRTRPETREAIVDRAVDLASVEGLEGLTIGRLSAEIGMSKSGLFRHFGSKQELQLATVAAAVARFVRDVLEPALEEPAGMVRLRALCELYLDHLERQVFSGGCFWAATATEFDDRPGPVRDAIRDALAAWVALLAREARAAGLDQPDQLAFELQALVQGANTHYRLFRDAQAFARARTAVEHRLSH